MSWETRDIIFAVVSVAIIVILLYQTITYTPPQTTVMLPRTYSDYPTGRFSTIPAGRRGDSLNDMDMRDTYSQRSIGSQDDLVMPKWYSSDVYQPTIGGDIQTPLKPDVQQKRKASTSTATSMQINYVERGSRRADQDDCPNNVLIDGNRFCFANNRDTARYSIG